MDKPIPEAVRAWLDAEGKFREAVETYNARVAFVRAERERGNWPGPDTDLEYQAMEEARHESATSLRAMYAALTAAHQEQAVAVYAQPMQQGCGEVEEISEDGIAKIAWQVGFHLEKEDAEGEPTDDWQWPSSEGENMFPDLVKFARKIAALTAAQRQ